MPVELARLPRKSVQLGLSLVRLVCIEKGKAKPRPVSKTPWFLVPGMGSWIGKRQKD